MSRQGDASSSGKRRVLPSSEGALSRQQLGDLYRHGLSLRARETADCAITTPGGSTWLRLGGTGEGVVTVAAIDEDELGQSLLAELLTYAGFFVLDAAQAAAQRGKLSGQTNQNIETGS